MIELKAKPIIQDKFWIVEHQGERFATLRRNDRDQYILSNQYGMAVYHSDDEIQRDFGPNFFTAAQVKTVDPEENLQVHGFPTCCVPYNEVFNVQEQLPLFTKRPESNSFYCAGHYAINFGRGWVKSFCPKLITVQRNPRLGPFRTELELRQAIANANAK